MFQRHDGGVTAPDDLFFADPPPEIGPISSAQTDAKVNQRRSAGCAAYLIAPLGGALGFLGGLALGLVLSPRTESLAMPLGVLGAIAAAIAAFLLVRRLTPLRGECSYVGATGLALFKRGGERLVVRFADVADVRGGTTSYGKYGIATSHLTEWLFVDSGGRPLGRIAGMSFPKGEQRAEGDHHHWLGMRAHAAWLASRAESPMAAALAALRDRLRSPRQPG
jgi:hypothetical protein